MNNPFRFERSMQAANPRLSDPNSVSFLLTTPIENDADREEITTFWKEAIDVYCWERGLYQFSLLEISKAFEINVVDGYGEPRAEIPYNLSSDEVLKTVVSKT